MYITAYRMLYRFATLLSLLEPKSASTPRALNPNPSSWGKPTIPPKPQQLSSPSTVKSSSSYAVGSATPCILTFSPHWPREPTTLKPVSPEPYAPSPAPQRSNAVMKVLADIMCTKGSSQTSHTVLIIRNIIIVRIIGLIKISFIIMVLITIIIISEVIPKP